jgi:hypothetical protein
VTTPLTGTFDEVKGHDGSLIRKMLEMAVFIGAEDAPAITSIVDVTTGDELVIPGGYVPLGMTTKEQGLTLTPAVEMSEITAYGYAQPVRRDVVSRNITVAFTMQETRKAVLEAYHGIDLSAVVASANGEIVINQPDRPAARYVRLLFVAVDGDGADAKFHAEWLPRAILTDASEQSWSETDALTYGVTYGADLDSAVGTSQRSFWAGPGMSPALVSAMGFAA